ncbi:hypothetical protein Dimus_021694 [Dionaea muscipula]
MSDWSSHLSCHQAKLLHENKERDVEKFWPKNYPHPEVPNENFPENSRPAILWPWDLLIQDL